MTSPNKNPRRYWTAVADLARLPSFAVSFRWRGFSGRIHEAKHKIRWDPVYEAWRGTSLAAQPVQIKLTKRQQKACMKGVDR